jgi:hypothetical protein
MERRWSAAFAFVRTEATDPLTYTVTAFKFLYYKPPEDGHQ